MAADFSSANDTAAHYAAIHDPRQRTTGMQTYHRANNQEIERLQKRALWCILGDVNYEEACSTLGLITSADRREQLTQLTFFEQHTHPDSCLITHLIPPKSNLSIYLRHTPPNNELPKTRTVTVRYANSFLPYCLHNFT